MPLKLAAKSVLVKCSSRSHPASDSSQSSPDEMSSVYALIPGTACAAKRRRMRSLGGGVEEKEDYWHSLHLFPGFDVWGFATDGAPKV